MCSTAAHPLSAIGRIKSFNFYIFFIEMYVSDLPEELDALVFSFTGYEGILSHPSFDVQLAQVKKYNMLRSKKEKGLRCSALMVTGKTEGFTKTLMRLPKKKLKPVRS